MREIKKYVSFKQDLETVKTHRRVGLGHGKKFIDLCVFCELGAEGREEIFPLAVCGGQTKHVNICIRCVHADITQQVSWRKEGQRWGD